MTEKNLLKQMAEGQLLINFVSNTEKIGVDNLTVRVLKNRIKLLETYWQNVLGRHKELCAIRDQCKDHEYFKNDLFFVYETAYTVALSDTEDRIAALSPDDPTSSNASPNTLSNLQPQHSSLPRLPLPRFSGDQLDWETFKERFSAMIKDVPTLFPVTKLQHLLSCLDGDAARRLRSLEVTGVNFEVAWNILLRRYDDKRVRLSAHMGKLLSMQTVPHKSVKEITCLMDTVNEARRVFKLLDRPLNHWDDWFVEIVVSRLDARTREDWEKTLEGTSDFPTFNKLATFLEYRVRTLEATRGYETISDKAHMKKKPTVKHATTMYAHHTSTGGASGAKRPTPEGCSQCRGNHFIGYCPTFLKHNLSKRLSTIKELKLCENCLRKGHAPSGCTSKNRCRVQHCNQMHHTLLHPSTTMGANKEKGLTSAAATPGVNVFTAQVKNLNLHNFDARESALMPTALVSIKSASGSCIYVRALIDPQSECSFLTEHVVAALGLIKQRTHVDIGGVGAEVSITSKYKVSAVLHSRKQPNFSLPFSAMVLGKLTGVLPRTSCDKRDWKHLAGLELADPNLFDPGAIDCILGNQVYPAIIQDGLRKGLRQEPVAQKTVLGWIVTGTVPASSATTAAHNCFYTFPSIDVQLQRFWELEEIPARTQLSPEDLACEEHFLRSHSRDSQGRYTVRLPFTQPPDLPDSLSIAKVRFLQLERRLRGKPDLKEAYKKFMKEFLELGHMEVVPFSARTSQHNYYMPHHAVEKLDGSGKIRVVFNASQKTKSGKSLNDYLFSGQKLQTDITAILLRWRFFSFVFTADIVKMFRQFRMHHDDCDWLRILWRNSEDEELCTYRMLTVVYGTACAPFQAIRTLKQLAADERPRFPEGSIALDHHCYVDDILGGGDTVDQALEMKRQLSGILKSAGMELDKWAANDSALLPLSHQSQSLPRCFAEVNTVSTLGLQWTPIHDSFSFKVSMPSSPRIITKRIMLSEVAKLFDPLGWAAPIVVAAKILIQRLWIKKVDWDQAIDEETRHAWLQLRDNLKHLEALHIPRWLGTYSHEPFYLHGFADASQLAYAACIYLVTAPGMQPPRSKLVVAKTKLAPIKTVSIPRLELCAALLLSRLLVSVQREMQREPAAIYCWSDSKVTLAWISSHPSRWSTFVANRVSEILTSLPQVRWGHVKTAENPADIASRGIQPQLLLQNQLWWRGPDWLVSKYSGWLPSLDEYCTDLEEKRDLVAFATSEQTQDSIEQLIGRFSNLSKLTRVTAFIFRWRKASTSSDADTASQPSVLSADELLNARTAVIRAVQLQHYAAEVKFLRKGESLPASSKLSRFLPYLDAQGVMRIGGRLQNAFLRENEKHPAIIPNESHLAELLIRDAHLRTLHGGPQLVTSYLLRAYWIVRARNRIRRLTHQCVSCTRFRGSTLSQQMAPLPAVRVTPARPFNATGLDYAGPYWLRTSKGRGQKAFKGYLAIFVCMVTRAVHLEVVSDYTTQGFLLAFRRFVSRRGLCSTVYSDNGTTFQGASTEISRLFQATSRVGQEIAAAVASDGVNWLFIPPSTPHFGGLWEAGVKSAKHHLRRVIGDSKLTYEEFSTLTAQIEACLNSRPLCALSNDPEDVTALTPGHFLIGTALKALPEPCLSDLSVSGVQRYRITIVMRAHFWKRWQREVLHQLQQRAKWLRVNDAIREGDLVLLTEERQPPTKWPLARVERCHPGADGLTRVLTLRTATTTLTRPLVKVIRLPVDSPADEIPSQGSVTAGGASPGSSEST